MISHIRFTLIIIIIITSSTIISSCKGVSGEVGYQPPFVPLTISVDTNGKFHFEVEHKVQYPTPLGTFSAKIIADPVAHFNVKKTLTIRMNGTDHIYDLHGTDFDISFSEGYYEQIKLSRRNNNIILELRTISDNQQSINNPQLPASTKKPNEVTSSNNDTLSAIISDEVIEVNLRRSPGYIHKDDNTDVVTKIPSKATVEILDGPETADSLQWWYISWRGYTGWLADHTGSGRTILIFK